MRYNFGQHVEVERLQEGRSILELRVNGLSPMPRREGVLNPTLLESPGDRIRRPVPDRDVEDGASQRRPACDKRKRRFIAGRRPYGLVTELGDPLSEHFRDQWLVFDYQNTLRQLHPTKFFGLPGGLTAKHSLNVAPVLVSGCRSWPDCFGRERALNSKATPESYVASVIRIERLLEAHAVSAA